MEGPAIAQPVAVIMTAPDAPPPLWLEAIPDREPWRRGRAAICFITFILLLGLGAFIAWTILQGNLRTFLLAAGLGGLGCLFLYFIWVGRNWPRWIIAPFFALAGFASLIWGIRDGNGPLLVAGMGGLICFSYLALAPSVYAFARHQRERITLGESLVVALIFLLLRSRCSRRNPPGCWRCCHWRRLTRAACCAGK